MERSRKMGLALARDERCLSHFSGLIPTIRSNENRSNADRSPSTGIIQSLRESKLLKFSIGKLMVIVAISAINMFLFMLLARNLHDVRINVYFLDLLLMG